jgi:hypothetical protein
MRRLLCLLTLLALLGMTSAPSSGAPAPEGMAGATTGKPAPREAKTTKVQKYVHNWVFRSTKLHRCAFVEATGKIVGKWEYAYGSGEQDKDTLSWTGIRLRDPAVTVKAWPILGAGCDSTQRLRAKADISQGWFQSGCDLDVSVSVGFPWSVSATPELDCGDNRVGHRTSTEGPSRRTLAQYNTGAPLHFEGTLASVRAGGIGFSGVISVRMHTRNASDLVRKRFLVSLNK